MTKRFFPRRRDTLLLLAASAALVSGCAALRQPKPPQLFLLRPDVPKLTGDPVRWRLAIAAPDTNASLDTQRIALTRAENTLDYFADAAWTDRVPLLFQRAVIEALDESGRILSVDKDTAGVEADYLLETEIRGFEARYSGNGDVPGIVVSVQVKLVRMPAREIAGSVFVSETAPAAANALDAIVGAFNKASGGAIAKIAAWTLSQPPPPPTD